MAMDLHSRIKKADLITDMQLGMDGRFDFLIGLHPMNILRMDEVHPSKDNDTHYLFLIWVRPQDHEELERYLRKTLKKFGKPDGPTPGTSWTVKILPDTGEGLIIISTWL